MTTFAQAFREARQRLGAGKTFTWNGKSYSTNLAEEGSGSRSRAPSSSPRPPSKPAATPARGRSLRAANTAADSGRRKVAADTMAALRRTGGSTTPRTPGRTSSPSRGTSSRPSTPSRPDSAPAAQTRPARPSAGTNRSATSMSQRERVAAERANNRQAPAAPARSSTRRTETRPSGSSSSRLMDRIRERVRSLRTADPND